MIFWFLEGILETCPTSLRKKGRFFGFIPKVAGDRIAAPKGYYFVISWERPTYRSCGSHSATLWYRDRDS